VNSNDAGLFDRRYWAISAGVWLAMYACADAGSAARPSTISWFTTSALPWASATDAGLSVGIRPGGRLLASEMPPLNGTARWKSLGCPWTTSGDVNIA
jgi:hypothetical protein